ncbi:DUF222 domain-containing protein [Microbacterium sp. NPDC057407]|uniref:HNH endonuclease signature motif containing protein n=1 Tax=Microbacterium sp. NPDC057407 TaxID=3346120 RepID=UPI0036730BD9
MLTIGDDPVPIPDALDLVVEASHVLAIIAAQRLERVHAMRREALADMPDRGLQEVVERGIRLELAAALRITEQASGDMLALAEALVERYPSVLESLSRARVTEKHAQILVRVLDEVDPHLRDRVVDDALPLAEAQPVGTFARRLRRIVDDARASTLTERFERALTSRRVVVEHVDDGMAWLHALVPAVEAHAIHARVTAIAKTIAASPHENRTLDQVRADVLSDLLIDGTTTVHPAAARGIRATVAVTVPVLALLATDDIDREDQGLAPATVEGIGPIPLTRARELCGEADGWMRVLTHPETGIVLSVGRDRYRPPPALRHLVRWRAERCMAPGCAIPASRCEIDHTVAWAEGGDTSLDNLAPLCTGHHTVKHHGGWTVAQIPDSGGALSWTSPAGRRYVVAPERPTPVLRAAPTRPHDTAAAPF